MSKMGIEESDNFDAHRDGRAGIAEPIFKMIDCPEGKNGCNGLAVAVSGEVIEIKQRDNGYVAGTRQGWETLGNCPSYERCYKKLISQSERKSAEIEQYILGEN